MLARALLIALVPIKNISKNTKTVKGDSTMSAEIREIKVTTQNNQAGEQELLNYLLWSMKHDVDPHELHEDPIEAFRKEQSSLESGKSMHVA